MIGAADKTFDLTRAETVDGRKVGNRGIGDLHANYSRWPFVKVDRATLNAAYASSGLYIGPHFFHQFPQNINNNVPGAEYNDVNYQNPLGESRAWRDKGGLTRQRSQVRSVIPNADTLSEDAFFLTDNRNDVRQIHDMGCNVIYCNILSFNDANYRRLERIAEVCEAEYDDIKVIPQLDFHGGTVLANAVNIIEDLVTSYPNGLQQSVNGRYIICCYGGELITGDDWVTIIEGCEALSPSISIDILPIFTSGHIAGMLDISTALAAASPVLSSRLLGGGRWGDGTPGGATSRANGSSDFAAYGKYCRPITPQVHRPKNPFYQAANNLDCFENCLTDLDADTAFAMFVTWNDLSEGTEICPLTGNGFILYHRAAYWLQKQVMGVEPTIAWDSLYLFYRKQLTTATFNPELATVGYQPNETLTLSASTVGAGRTFTSTAANVANPFMNAGEVGRKIKEVGGPGVALITAWTSVTVVTATIEIAFSGTSFVSGEWGTFGDQTNDFSLNSGTAQDEVEALAYLAAPGTLAINIDGANSTLGFGTSGLKRFAVPVVAPATTIYTRLTRGGITKLQLNGAYSITDEYNIQDLAFKGSGSRCPAIEGATANSSFTSNPWRFGTYGADDANASLKNADIEQQYFSRLSPYPSFEYRSINAATQTGFGVTFAQRLTELNATFDFCITEVGAAAGINLGIEPFGDDGSTSGTVALILYIDINAGETVGTIGHVVGSSESPVATIEVAKWYRANLIVDQFTAGGVFSLSVKDSSGATIGKTARQSIRNVQTNPVKHITFRDGTNSQGRIVLDNIFVQPLV